MRHLRRPAHRGFYSLDPNIMWEVDIYMEKVKQDFQHAGVVQISHVCVAQLCKRVVLGQLKSKWISRLPYVRSWSAGAKRN